MGTVTFVGCTELTMGFGSQFCTAWLVDRETQIFDSDKQISTEEGGGGVRFTIQGQFFAN